ncbi:AFR043Wp [Eremothecium gossypii ATCC 10895]|uniref:AFR043Wp n=1 Tax=Eremothecium gossypii (strain ATCC 10895 / CBS 109.51 / FGSC 9923 / NRRL Y-1056) TaxID=284811 RepID=Q754M9_EREGS|nr:AFR043Wp [Eremothecium gossypii ATCC 10895]AAS53414.1 AFR043Wp [Eremothecium gossypii ATCC 10895]AEY97726.1 FAFR043Wp [Eremothecium gossypii FDAG1]
MSKKKHEEECGERAGGKVGSPIVVAASTDSMSMLTKPQLFGIYDEEIVESEDTEIYEEAKKSAGRMLDDMGSVGARSRVRTRSQKYMHLVSSLVILGISGIAYHQLSRNLHDNDLLHEDFTSRPLVLGVKLCQQLSFGMLPTWAGYAVEGILFGSLLPAVDYWRRISVGKVNLSGVLRSINAMLGVSFGIRRVEWSSSLQASGAWFLLDGILWLFFDGSFSVFLLGFAVGLVTAVTCYEEITDFSQLLYFIDFYFLGLLFFGRLGRYLYQR